MLDPDHRFTDHLDNRFVTYIGREIGGIPGSVKTLGCDAILCAVRKNEKESTEKYLGRGTLVK